MKHAIHNLMFLFTALFAMLIASSVCTRTSYVLYSNPVRDWCLNLSIHQGELGLRSGPMKGAPASCEFVRTTRRDPALSGLLVQKVGGALGLNIWRNYTTSNQRGNGPVVVDSSTYQMTITIDAFPGFLICLSAGVCLLVYRRRSPSRRPAFPVSEPAEPKENSVQVPRGDSAMTLFS